MRDQLNPYYKYMWITNLWVIYEKSYFSIKTVQFKYEEKYIKRKRWVK